MDITCISDLHGYYPDNLPGGDLLIIAGDLTARDTWGENENFMQWLYNQKYGKMVFISGNHDNYYVDHINFSNPDFGIFNLQDSGIQIDDFYIWGTPWTKTFGGMNPKCKAFTCDTEEELAEKFDLIPDDTDILISHGPMLHMLDANSDGYSCGSSALRDAVNRVKPSILVCGHIHEQGGKSLLYKHFGKNTFCINASHVNEHYKPINGYMRVEI